ncbi:phage tail protein, partial [Salmonella enterica]|nr:phage tail protein [Salmonella enterica]
MKLAWDGFINCATEINWQYASARQNAVFSTTAYCPSKTLCPNA